jgi:hypothetical protein
MSALQEEFAQSASRLIQKAVELGFTVTLGEAWRTAEQAQWDADHHIGVAHSLHMDRLAIDLNVFKDGVYQADDSGGAYTALGTWWEGLGPMYRWGGRFKLVDLDHFSLSPDGIRG